MSVSTYIVLTCIYSLPALSLSSVLQTTKNAFEFSGLLAGYNWLLLNCCHGTLCRFNITLLTYNCMVFLLNAAMHFISVTMLLDFIYSFVFSNCFILLRVTLDPILAIRPGFQFIICTMHTPIRTKGQFNINSSTCFLWFWEETSEPRGNPYRLIELCNLDL